METQLTLLAQSLALPLALSYVARWVGTRNIAWLASAVFIAWLIPFLWIAGVPSLPPGDAVAWTAWLGLAFAVYSLRDNQLSPLINTSVPTLLIVVGIASLAWPVVATEPGTGLLIELALFILLGLVLYFRQCHIAPAAPALALAISAGGLGVVSALGGSLMVGQLAGALAAAVGAFAIHEMRHGKGHSIFSRRAIRLAGLLNLWLLVVVRVYAEIALPVVILLAMALLVGQITRSRFGVAGAAVGAVGAVLLAWLTQEPGGYY